MSAFAPPVASAPSFAGVRARPWQKYAIEWVKRRLRALHSHALAAGQKSPLTEPAAHLYLLLATYVPNGQHVTEEIDLRDLVAVMHCHPLTVRRSRKVLEHTLGDVELIAGGQGTQKVRFEFTAMKGPLFAERGRARSNIDTQSSKLSPNLDPESPKFISPNLDTESPKLPNLDTQSSKCAARTYKVLEEEGSSSTAEGAEPLEASMTIDKQRAALDAAVAQDLHTVDEFCDWWPGGYPSHNGGVLNRIRPCDRRAAEILTIGTGRTLNRLQTLAIELWSPRGTYSQSDRSFIAGSDRSICVLLQKVTVIEREVARLGLDAPPEDLLWQEICEKWVAYTHRGSSARLWLEPFRIVSDAEGVLRVWSPTFNDRERIARFGFEEALEKAVKDVLGAPRCLEFTWGDESQTEPTGTEKR